MQFKRVGNRVQVLRYEGYDKEKRRAIVKMIGSFDFPTLKPRSDLKNSLTVEEKEELQSYIENERKSRIAYEQTALINNLAPRISKVARMVDEDPACMDLTSAWAMYSAMDRLQRAFKKAGYSKPPRQEKVGGQQVDTRQLQLDTDASPE